MPRSWTAAPSKPTRELWTRAQVQTKSHATLREAAAPSHPGAGGTSPHTCIWPFFSSDVVQILGARVRTLALDRTRRPIFDLFPRPKVTATKRDTAHRQTRTALEVGHA